MAILFVQGFWNFLIVRRYFNEWVPVVHYHQLLVSRKRVLFWERPKVFTTWANESRCLRNKVLNREEKNYFRLRDYTDISMTILEHFDVPHGRRGFQASSSFPLSFKMFCQMERLQSFSSMHAWKYTQRHPVSFHLNHVPSPETLETVQLHWKQCEALRTRMVPVWANDWWPVTLTGGPLRARIASRNKDYPCCLHLIGAGIDYFFTSKSHNNGKIL